MLKVTGSRSKVALGSDHDVAQLDPGRNICTKFELLPVLQSQRSRSSPDKVLCHFEKNCYV